MKDCMAYPSVPVPVHVPVTPISVPLFLSMGTNYYCVAFHLLLR